jgi:2Fe-2S ferredoxin
MPRVTFISADGTATEASGDVGQSVMSVAVNAGIEVILAECGGACACGTCHCYVDAAWVERLSRPSDGEAAMIDCVIAPRPESRLTCQLRLTDELDGLVLHLPPAQY